MLLARLPAPIRVAVLTAVAIALASLAVLVGAGPSQAHGTHVDRDFRDTGETRTYSYTVKTGETNVLGVRICWWARATATDKRTVFVREHRLATGTVTTNEERWTRISYSRSPSWPGSC